MKKALAIILCVAAVCFASCNKEKPNQKFIGDYSGNMTANLTLSALGQQIDIDPADMPIEMQITAGDANDKVVAICTIQEETRTLNGTAIDNNVDFEPLVINENIEGTEVNLTIILHGTLNDTALAVSGDITGSGTFVYDQIPAPIPFTATGSANGILNKVAQQGIKQR